MVSAKTFIKGRDCGRLCENVFMSVWIGAPTGPSLGVGFDSKWTCQKSLCLQGRGPWMQDVKWLL